MSVPASERMLANTQFVHDSFCIYQIALRVCLSMPKRYTYFIALPLLNKVRAVCDLCVRANNIFPIKFREDFIMRRKLLFEAKGIASSIIVDITALINIKNSNTVDIHPLATVKESVLNALLKMIDKEINLLDRVIRSDEKKYNNLGNENCITDNKNNIIVH